MKCDESQELLHGYVDGELDLVRSLEMQKHLEECPTCAAAVQQHAALRQRIRAAGPYRPAPPELRGKIEALLQQATRENSIAGQTVGSTPLPAGLQPWTWRWLSIAALLLLAASLAWNHFQWGQTSISDNLLAQEAIASHIRSLMAEHLMDVASTDQHTVKPWFNGRIDFSPTVKDLASEGFPLVGGRLDYLGQRPVTALVYKRREHVINLFVWPAATAVQEPLRTFAQQGFHAFHWTQGGFAYWAVSDLNEEELRQFVQLIQQK